MIERRKQDFETRSDVVYYICNRHNEVNRRLGKDMYDCDDIWKDFGIEKPKD